MIALGRVLGLAALVYLGDLSPGRDDLAIYREKPVDSGNASQQFSPVLTSARRITACRRPDLDLSRVPYALTKICAVGVARQQHTALSVRRRQTGERGYPVASASLPRSRPGREEQIGVVHTH